MFYQRDTDIVLPALGSVKHYDWGNKGTESLISRFKGVDLSGKEIHVNQDSPMAELWFGAHPSGPAYVQVDDKLVNISEFMKEFPEMVGNISIYTKYKKSLPYLFKILSVAKPLSLQAHPDRKMAEILHGNDSKNYPDPNHKPELAIALTEFQILCDFRPISEIVEYISKIAPLRTIIGESLCEALTLGVEKGESPETLLSKCFESLIRCQPEVITRETERLITEYKGSELISEELYNVINMIANLHPGDPGIFAPLMLNYIRLQPGQAVYLKANKLHAYLSGDCIECMACSDNVVRAAMTPKFRDVDTLIKMLDYMCVDHPEDLIFTPKIQINQNLSIRSFVPTEEFKVDEISISFSSLDTTKACIIPSKPSGSFMVVIKGVARSDDFFDISKVHELTCGISCFIPPKIDLKIYDIESDVLIYQCYC